MKVSHQLFKKVSGCGNSALVVSDEKKGRKPQRTVIPPSTLVRNRTLLQTSMDPRLAAAVVAAAVMKQTEARLHGLEVSQSSVIDWGEVAQDTAAQGAAFRWSPAQCQLLWRWAAYGHPVGDLGAAAASTELLPDSDGEDDEDDTGLEQGGAAVCLLRRLEKAFLPSKECLAVLLREAVHARSGLATPSQLDAAVIAIVGPPPPEATRSAFDLFVAHYGADLEGGSVELRPVWEACDASLRESFKAQEAWDAIAAAEALKRYNELASEARRFLADSLPRLTAVSAPTSAADAPVLSALDGAAPTAGTAADVAVLSIVPATGAVAAAAAAAVGTAEGNTAANDAVREGDAPCADAASS